MQRDGDAVGRNVDPLDQHSQDGETPGGGVPGENLIALV
jgi:hypothetical protein